MKKSLLSQETWLQRVGGLSCSTIQSTLEKTNPQFTQDCLARNGSQAGNSHCQHKKSKEKVILGCFHDEIECIKDDLLHWRLKMKTLHRVISFLLLSRPLTPLHAFSVASLPSMIRHPLAHAVTAELWSPQHKESEDKKWILLVGKTRSGWK